MLKRLKSSLGMMIREKRWLEIALFVVFIAQLVAVISANLFLIRDHVWTDPSWTILRSILMWKEKTIESPYWVETTNIFLDTSLPLAVLIYGITKNAFLAFGIANCVVLLGILLCAYSIMELNGINDRAALIVLNLLVCPYLMNGFEGFNDLGYSSVILTVVAYYNVRTLIFLLTVRELCLIWRKRATDVWGYVTAALCFVAGFSSGAFILVTFLLPCLLAVFELVLIRNDWGELKSKSALYCYALTGATVLGKLASLVLLEFRSIDSSRAWTTLSSFWNHVGAVFLGLMKLVGALPLDSTQIATAGGIRFVFSLFIFVVLLVAVAYGLKKLIKSGTEQDCFILVLVNVVFFNVIMFSLFDATYGLQVFEERYLIIMYVAMMLLVAHFISALDPDLIFSRLLVVGMLISILVCDAYSDVRYVSTTTDDWYVNDILEVVKSQDAGLVYFWGGDLIQTQMMLRPLDTDHIFKAIEDYGVYHHDGDYKYLEDCGDYDGPTLMVIKTGSEVIPEKYLSQYTFLQEVEDMSIYRCDYNPLDLTAGITGQVSVEYPSTPGVTMAHGQFDGISYVSDGSDGYIMSGPGADTVSGVYDFVLDYEILSGDDATFDVSLDDGSAVVAASAMSPSQGSVVLEDVTLEDGHTMEYRVSCTAGTVVKIKKVTILKK